MAVLAVALRMRVLEAQNHILYDLQHFYRFAETLFTSDHLNYYASVVTQPFTYAHLPLFPLLLAPVLRLYDAFGWEPVLAIKTLVYTFDLATALLLFVLARRNRLPAAGALLIAGLWLLSPWVLEAGAVNGHVTSVGAFFLVAALLRFRVPWQAGVLLALAVTARSEFVIAALALAGVFARRGAGAAAGYVGGFGVVAGLIVGPFLLVDRYALYWAVVGHLQGRGDGLPVVRAFVETATGTFPDALSGPQTWVMPGVLLGAFAIGWFVSEPAAAVFKATILYVLALTVVHNRYFVLPVAAGLAYAARPGIWGWPLVVYLVEHYVVLPTNTRWMIRALAVALFFFWPLLRRVPGFPRPRASETSAA